MPRQIMVLGRAVIGARPPRFPPSPPQVCSNVLTMVAPQVTIEPGQLYPCELLACLSLKPLRAFWPMAWPIRFTAVMLKLAAMPGAIGNPDATPSPFTAFWPQQKNGIPSRSIGGHDRACSCDAFSSIVISATSASSRASVPSDVSQKLNVLARPARQA